nr:hypothetical protein [Sphingomonas sp. Y57]
MAILIPAYPGPASAVPGYLDWGGVISSPLGGVDQKLNRLGDRFTIDVTMNTMPTAEDATAWVAALIQAQKDGGIFPWPQAISVNGSGDAVIDGPGQAGTTLKLRGLSSGRTFLRGQFISVVHGGRRYLHIIAAAGVANGSGKVSLLVEPMLRVAYSDGAVVEIDEPKIEGFLEGNRRDWTIDVAMNIGLQFRITEAE